MRVGAFHLAFLFLQALSVAEGFTLLPLSAAKKLPTTSSQRQLRLNEIDEMCVSNVAELCLEKIECDPEEYEALVNRLQEQRDELAARVKEMDTILTRIRAQEFHVNGETK